MNYKKIFKNIKEEIMKTNRIECKVCSKPIISYGFVTSSYWFCSKKCLKKFRSDRYANHNK